MRPQPTLLPPGQTEPPPAEVQYQQSTELLCLFPNPLVIQERFERCMGWSECLGPSMALQQWRSEFQEFLRMADFEMGPDARLRQVCNPLQMSLENALAGSPPPT